MLAESWSPPTVAGFGEAEEDCNCIPSKWPTERAAPAAPGSPAGGATALPDAAAASLEAAAAGTLGLEDAAAAPGAAAATASLAQAPEGGAEGLGAEGFGALLADGGLAGWEGAQPGPAAAEPGQPDPAQLAAAAEAQLAAHMAALAGYHPPAEAQVAEMAAALQYGGAAMEAAAAGAAGAAGAAAAPGIAQPAEAAGMEWEAEGGAGGAPAAETAGQRQGLAPLSLPVLEELGAPGVWQGSMHMVARTQFHLFAWLSGLH